METLIDRIKRHEGFVRIPKPDAKGMYVIGYGHDIAPDQAHDYANGISETDAEDLLEQDVAKTQAQVAQYLPWTDDLPAIRWGILVEMTFQMGIGGLLTFEHMLKCAHSGDDDGVVKSMLDSVWHKQTPERCEELANLWLNGESGG